MPDKEKWLFRDPLFWAAMLICGAVLVLTLWWGIGNDAGMFSYCSWVWKHYNLPPYVGCMDGDYPGIFIIHRLVLDLIGEQIIDFRIFDVLVQFTCLGMIFYLARRLAGASLAGLLACVFYTAYYFYLGYSMAAQREGFILWQILLALTLWFVLGPRVYLRAALIGLVAGFIFLIKPTFGLVWPAFGCMILAEGFRGRRKSLVFQLALFSAGCLLPAALWVLWYWHLHYLRDLYLMTVWFVFNVYGGSASYSQFKPSPGSEQPLALTGFGLLAYAAYKFLAEEPMILAGSLVLIIKRWAMTGPGRERKLFVMLLVLIGTVVLPPLIDKMTIYNRVPAWGLASILAGAGWSEICAMLAAQRSEPVRKFAGLVFALALTVIVFASLQAESLKFTARYTFRNLGQGYEAQMDGYYAVSEYLRANLKPDDEVYYFGAVQSIPFQIKRKLLVPFPWTHYLIWTGKNGQLSSVQLEWRKNFVDTFFKIKPRFIVVTTEGSSVFNLPGFEVIMKEKFPEIWKVVETDYHPAGDFGAIKVLERN